MSRELSPDVEKMDLSEDSSSPEDPALRNLAPSMPKEPQNSEKDVTTFLDNLPKNLTLAQNATDCHPLMRSAHSTNTSSPVSPDYPDLIPEKPKSKHGAYEKQVSGFVPQAHSTLLDQNNTANSNTKNSLNESRNVDVNKLDFELPALGEYSEKLPEFPDSPSALKKSSMFDLPLEVTTGGHAGGELSDNENDKSVYEAHLSSNLQNVSLTMNEKEGNLNFLARNKRSNKLRRVKVVHTEASEESDISSLDSISESLKSENVFTGEFVTSDEKPETEDTSPELIEPLSAAEERRHARHWQRMILPGGGPNEQRTIDMRVIEPYKRVLSHGGYLRAGGHTAIVIFSACYLPDRSRVDYVYVMDNLFLYVLWTLERLVTEDYVLVYLHGGATRLPAFSWLKRCYQMVGRKLRKNLSHLYLVHPTLWIKTMLFMAKPFISSKFYRKITYVSTLRELMVRVPLEGAAIPDKVKAFDQLNFGTT